MEKPITNTATPEGASISATKTADGRSVRQSRSHIDKNFLPFWYVLAFALMLRFWYNFGTFGMGHPNAYASADASEYLRYADALGKIISGHASGPMSEWLKEFVITGPAMPVFLLAVTALTGQPFDPANSTTALAAQSLISALTAGLIYLIARRLYESKTALYAGVFAAIYPAFIVNSGRLYSETFATFIECLAMLFIVRGFFPAKRLPLSNFFLGTALIVLELTRSAMVLLTAVCLPIVFLQGLFSTGGKQKNWRQASLRLALVLAGMAAVLAPWLLFEKAAYNKMTLVVDRVGHYNLFVGTNTETQGFLSYPYPDGRGIEAKSFLTLVRQAFDHSPSRFIKLALDKPARLLKAPWNDYRAAIGPFDYKLQVALHQAILLLGVIGILLASVVSPRRHARQAQQPGEQNPQEQDREELDREERDQKEQDQKKHDLEEYDLEAQNPENQSSELQSPEEKSLEKRKIWGRATLLLAFALNLPYLLFITVPRYNLTAMPFVIIFAAAGLTTIIYLLKAHQLAKAPKALLLFTLCLFIFLRDDLKDIFVFNQDPVASLVFVQGQDLLAKGLIGAAFGVALFASIYFSLSFLVGYKKLARTLTVIAALIALPLIALPQRVNGRPGEGIFTLERPGECVTGTIPMPRAKNTDQPEHEAWYLLIDCEDPTLLSSKLELTINGKKIKGPLIPGISALDDWHYLKQMASGRAYLECAYIYDCMTQPSAMSNLDLRQWFYIPLAPSFVSEARRRGCLNVTIDHRVNEPTKLFGAALGKDSDTIPSRALYSWEKAFYGVENDSGLTDSRYDEKVPRRQAKWKMNFGKSGEDLDHFDLNLRLLCLKSSLQAGSEITASGSKDVSLPLSEKFFKEGSLTLVRATLSYAKDYKPQNQSDSKVKEARPQLSLEWLDNKGKTVFLLLPWLKKTPDTLDVAIPCDLSKIQGSQLTLKAHYIDPDCKIRLGATTIAAHPIFGDGRLF